MTYTYNIDGDEPTMTEHQIPRRKALGLASLGAVSLATVLAGCGSINQYPKSWDKLSGEGNGKPNRGGVLRYGLSTEPVNFEPHISTGAASDVTRQMIYNGLLAYDDNGEVVDDLAESHEWIDPTTFEATLRRGVRFHDGTELTPKDVVFSFERIMDPATSATAASLFTTVESVQASGMKIRFKLNEPNNAFEHSLANPSSNVVSQRWVESGIDTKLNAMGTGPFKFKERIPGVSILVERFDDYFIPELPYLNAIEFIPMPDDYARVAALRTATVDIIDYVPATHVGVIKKNPNLRIYSDSTFGFGLVGFVTSDPVFGDKRVRQAVALGMDRDSMLQTAFLGQGEPRTGALMSPLVASYANELKNTVTYDPEQSRYLLKQAGREELDLNMVTTSSYSVIARPAEAMLPSLRETGLNPRLQRQEWLAFQETVKAKTFPCFVWGTAIKYGHPSALSEMVGAKSRWGQFMDFNDSKVEQLLSDARKQQDPSKATEMYLEVERRVLDEMPLTYTLRRIQGEASHTYVNGFAHPPKGAWTQASLRKVWLEDTK